MDAYPRIHEKKKHHINQNETQKPGTASWRHRNLIDSIPVSVASTGEPLVLLVVQLVARDITIW